MGNIEKGIKEAFEVLIKNGSKVVTDEIDKENEMALDVIHEAIINKWLVYPPVRTSGEMIEAGKVKPGSTILLDGIEYEVLDNAFTTKIGGHEIGVLCLSKNILFNKAFDEDNCNDWRSSSLRKYLNEEFIETLSFKDSLLKFERDLTSDDGLKDYGTCMDTVSLINDDEYRRYRYQISNKENKDGWGWWTVTPYSTPNFGYSYNARIVYSDGSRSYDSAYSGYCGVSPAFVLLPSFEVELIESEDEEEG